MFFRMLALIVKMHMFGRVLCIRFCSVRKLPHTSNYTVYYALPAKHTHFQYEGNHCLAGKHMVCGPCQPDMMGTQGMQRTV